MSAPVLLIATTNRGKFREFSALLADLPLRLTSLADHPHVPTVPEEGATYLANATEKALVAARSTGMPALADDSGLEVDALGGAPGVASARYAGPRADDAANVARLLEELAGVPPGRRTARFRCVIVVARPDGAILSAEGTCEGLITTAPRGEGGFGYDPVFFDPEAGATFAELPPAIKNARSHRARAVAALRGALLPFLGAQEA